MSLAIELGAGQEGGLTVGGKEKAKCGRWAGTWGKDRTGQMERRKPVSTVTCGKGRNQGRTGC